jgi:hypothetical protein
MNDLSSVILTPETIAAGYTVEDIFALCEDWLYSIEFSPDYFIS